MSKKLVFKLNELMGKHKIRSMRQLADETGISRITLTKIYEGKSTRVDANTLITLCEYFDCELTDLMEMVDE
jgi:putative transcriptional regulator